MWPESDVAFPHTHPARILFSLFGRSDWLFQCLYLVVLETLLEDIRGVDSNDILLETSDGVAGNSDISVGITEITKDNGATFLRVRA